MKTLVNVLVGAMVALLAVSGCALAQTPSDAEARLKEKNITLPPAPTFNYVNAVQVGNLLFLDAQRQSRQRPYRGAGLPGGSAGWTHHAGESTSYVGQP
jgi:hypothetical protein